MTSSHAKKKQNKKQQNSKRLWNEGGKLDTPIASTQILDHSLSWLGTCSYKCWDVKLVYGPKYAKFTYFLNHIILHIRQIWRYQRGNQNLEQKLLTLPEHLSSLPVFSGVRFTLSLVLYVCFVDRCLSFFFWSIVCSSPIYEFWLPLWYLQTLLIWSMIWRPLV
jgi:hypothetical protein